MSKEEAERSSALGRTSSMPPRVAAAASASEPPRTLPSIPPSTDDIDTDWGADDAAPPAPAPVAAQVEVAAPQPVVVAPAPVSVAPPPAPMASAPARDASARPNALRSQTLIGLPAPKPASSAPPPAREPVRQSPLRSRTLIGMAIPTPPARTSEPPPVRRSSVPPPPRTSSVPPAPASDVQTAPEKTRSSVPPPLPPPAPSIAPAAIANNKGVTSTFRPPPSAAPVAADAASNKRSGRGIVWLAVACALVGGLGYVIFHRPHTVTVAQAAAELPTAAPVVPPSPTAPAAELAPSTELAPPPGPVAPTASNEPASAASAAPAASADAPTPGMITVTVNSVPPKALFYHFGKQVGVAPFVVQLKPGERHAYEVGLPGHITRKVLLDGTKTELTVGLNEEPGTFIRRSPAF